jgi:hypothetical protein
MTDVFTVKPLAWTTYDDFAHVDVFTGTYQVRNEIYRKKRRWQWQDTRGQQFPCESMEDGKRLAQLHWQSEAGIGRYLEHVKP